MAFTAREIAEIVRQRLGDVDASRTAKILWAIPQALDRLARKVAANPKKRPLLLTPRETTDAILASDGSVDLATFLADPLNLNILIEYLEHGTIWYKEIITAITAEPASGVWTFDSNYFNHGNGFILVNGVQFNFVFAASLPNDVEISSGNITVSNFVDALNNSTDPLISVATYVLDSPIGFTVTGTYDTPGTVGNAFTMSPSVGDTVVTVSGATFTGGVDGSSGEITTNPLQFLRSPAMLNAPRIFGNDYYYYWMDGLILRTLEHEEDAGTPLVGELLFAVPYSPTMEQIEPITELHDDLIDKVIEIVVTPGADTAEDAEK